MTASPKSESTPGNTRDLVIVGGGPGGYVCALRAAQLGLSVALVESQHLGGTCLNWGCIPTKSLLSSAHLVSSLADAALAGITIGDVTLDYAVAHARSRAAVDQLTGGVAQLLKRAGVEVVDGVGRLVADQRGGAGVAVEVDGQLLAARNVVVATGAHPRPLPGVEFDGQRVISYRDALALQHVPASIVVVGAGPIGLELATVFSTYGAEVTVLEAQGQVLPAEDADVGKALARTFKRAGIEIRTSVSVDKIEPSDNGVTVSYRAGGSTTDISADMCLVAIGVIPNTDNVGLDDVGVAVDRGRIVVDDHLRTSADSIYAIGDVTGSLALAHVASAHGVFVAEHVAGRHPEPIDPRRIPRCVYTTPEVAAVGLTEQQARDQGLDVSTGTFPLVANGRALAMTATDGFVKVVADATTDELLGVHIVAASASEMIAGPTGLIGLEATLDEIIDTVHPHPTISEAIAEAAMAAKGEALHV